MANSPRIAILATHGFERTELTSPRDRLRDEGCEVHVISPDGGAIRSSEGHEWSVEEQADRALEGVEADDLDALILPGGLHNPDALRQNVRAVGLVRAFAETGKTLAAICHGPWMLIEAQMLAGRRATSYPSLRRDMENAGAHWVDEPVIVDDRLITSRRPADLPMFTEAIIASLKGRNQAERAREAQGV